MDRPLNSDRGDYSSERRDNYYGPGGGGGGGYHHRRGGRGRGRGRGGRGRFHHHHHQNHHQPYQNRRGPRRSGNRFQAEQTEHDPKQAALRQLLQLLNQVGALEAPKQQQQEEEDTTNVSESSSQRPVVKVQAERITAMTKFLCGPKAEMFLASSDPVDLAAKAGPLVSGLVHCNAVWPLQTPCYVALTLSVHEHHKGIHTIANNCLDYTTQCLARDLDQLLLEETPAVASTTTDTTTTTTTTDNNDNNKDRPRTLVRVRLALRYLCLLASTGALLAQRGEDEEEDPVLAATNQRPLTMAGFMEALVQAAVQATGERHQSNRNAAALLVSAVMSSIPYLRGILPTEWIQERLVDPIEEIMNEYASAFAPGIGSRSILLKGERQEETGEEAEEEEDDDDDEEEEEDMSRQICDSLQDSLRCIKHSLRDDSKPSQFALFTDAPWKELYAPSETKDDQAMDETTTTANEAVTTPLSFTGEALRLQVFPTCKSLTMLLGGEVPPETQLARRDLHGIVFGRLPIFGPPPEAADDDEDDDEEEEMGDGPVNERLQAYRTNFGMVDRFFLAEAVRDCLLSHEALVTDAGVERGSVKAVAEQVWSIGHLLLQEDNKGMEYCFLEAILSMIVQCGRGSPFQLIYLARVLLELTRIEPTAFSPAIALGVSTLFQDYMPALVPISGYNLSRWFAFHLTNTDYQWPAAYWKHWEPFVKFGWSTSRGAFVKGALSLMMENLSNPELLVSECLPPESSIVDHLVPPIAEQLSAHEETVGRIYDHGEDAATLLAYLIGDEVGESLSSESSWKRTGLLWDALLKPARAAHSSVKEAIDNTRSAGGEGAMEEDRDEAGDVLAEMTDKLDQYKETVLGVLAQDAADSSADTAVGELFLLERLSSATSFSPCLLEGCLHSCLLHKFVHVMSVVKWALGETADGSNSPPVLRWWNIASAAVEHGLLTEATSESSSKVDDAMAVEETSASARILNYLDPLLSYMVRRVSSLLQASSGTDDNKPNKLTPQQVELVEGFKVVVVDCHNRYYEMASGSTSTALQEALSESGVGGSNLASLLDADGSICADLLRHSLERL